MDSLIQQSAVLFAMREFVELGGPVLLAIIVLTAVMWTLILERVLYYRFVYRAQLSAVVTGWVARDERASWSAAQIRRCLLSQLGARIEQRLALIKVCVAICPLLGLLGTVTGMVGVFDTMAVTGTGDPQAMADGVAKATIPTMAGMVAALSGYGVSVWLHRIAKRSTAFAANELSAAEH